MSMTVCPYCVSAGRCWDHDPKPPAYAAGDLIARAREAADGIRMVQGSDDILPGTCVTPARTGEILRSLAEEVERLTAERNRLDVFLEERGICASCGCSFDDDDDEPCACSDNGCGCAAYWKRRGATALARAARPLLPLYDPERATGQEIQGYAENMAAAVVREYLDHPDVHAALRDVIPVRDIPAVLRSVSP